MALGQNKEMLCISFGERHYAIEYDYVEEITTDTRISQFPCLTGNFYGVINHKGNIIPVIWEKGQIPDKVPVILILKWNKYYLGVILTKPPYIIETGSQDLISDPYEGENLEIWKLKGIYCIEEQLYFLVDMERTMEGLVIYS